MNTPAIVYFVVPCYNDEDTLPTSVPVFLKKLRSLIVEGTISEKSRLLLINDGSADRTWDTILTLQQQNKEAIIGMNLAGNFGQHNALVAGMSFARDRADCVITIDSDLQDDIDASDQMLACFYSGKDVVLGVRNDRSSDGIIEKIGTKMFYLLMKTAKTGLITQHANYQLLSKKAMDRLTDNLPTNYFLPCAVSRLNLPSDIVTYQRFVRVAGTTGYSFSKKAEMVKNALFSYSAFPLKLISVAGAGSLLCAVACFFLFLFAGSDEITVLLFLLLTVLCLFGAGIFFALRIIGEYSMKAFEEAKKPKKYQIDSVLEYKNEAKPTDC